MTDKDFKSALRSAHTPNALSDLWHKSVSYMRQHLFVTLMSSVMMASGVVYAQIYFPELPTYKTVFGGAFFGLFCAACALGYRLFEID